MPNDTTNMVRIRFIIPTNYGDYNDVLWYTAVEYSKQDASSVSAAKQAMLDKWLATKTPPKVIAKTVVKEVKYKKEKGKE